MEPAPGDVIVLLGGATGRDGIGGATGSSKAVSYTHLEQNLVVIEAFLEAAKRYARGGYDVIVDGIVGPWFLGPWRALVREDYEDVYKRQLGFLEKERFAKRSACLSAAQDRPTALHQMGAAHAG